MTDVRTFLPICALCHDPVSMADGQTLLVYGPPDDGPHVATPRESIDALRRVNLPEAQQLADLIEEHGEVAAHESCWDEQFGVLFWSEEE